MLQELRHLIGRFPDRKDDIRELWQTNAAFESLAHQHGEITDRLHSLSGEVGEASREMQELRRRQTDLEDEMLTIMDQSSRI